MGRFDCIYTWIVTYKDSQQGPLISQLTDKKNSKSHQLLRTFHTKVYH